MGELLMTKRKYVVSWLILVLSLWFTPEAIGYDANFHLRITEEAINLLEKDEDKSLGNYLENNLRFENGLDKKFTGLGGLFYGPKEMLSNSELQEKSVKEWIKWGSKKEDHPDSGSLIEALVNHARRASKHFYDPVNEIGLTDHPYPGASVPSLNWASNHSDNGYSWVKAREYYFKALTSQTKEERDENFAKTFRVLGQVLHLLQDKAVPAHTRNDNHLYMPPYGNSLCGQDMYEDYWKGGVTFPDCDYPVIEFDQLKSEDNVKFNDFWDTDVGKGLAEYTNHNFVSRDTNLDVTYGIHNYVYPFKTGEHREDFTFQDKKGNWRTVKVTYIHTNAIDNYDSNKSVIPFKYLTVYSFFNCYTEELGHEPVYTLNRKCHEEYGKLLLPRAVGYSAGLLNYFFRGKLNAEMRYIRHTDPWEYYLLVTNESDEDMTKGTLTFLYEDKDGKYFPIKDASGEPVIIEDINIHAHQAYYGTSGYGIRFVLPLERVVNYILVFNGTLGNEVPGSDQEKGAIVGKVWNILEDTYVYGGRPNWSGYVEGHDLSGRVVISSGYYIDEEDRSRPCRTYYAYPPGWKQLHITIDTWRSDAWFYRDGCIVDIYEVDPTTFNMKTLTWNNQPERGRLIATVDLRDLYSSDPGEEVYWITLDIEGTQGIMIKASVENPPPDASRCCYLRSAEARDWRPYLTK